MTWICGCSALEARDEANAGKEELIHCNFQWARDHFEHAYDLKPKNPDIIMGLAISRALVLIANEDFGHILKKLGVKLSVSAYCHELSETDFEYTEEMDENGCVTKNYSSGNVVFHPCQNEDSCEFSEYIDKTLTFKEIFDTLKLYKNELESISRLSLFASQNIGDNYTIHDLNGIGDIHINRTDLHFISVLFSSLAMIAEISGNYEWDYSVKDVLSLDEMTCDEQAQWYNQHLLVKESDSEIDTDEVVNSFVWIMHQLSIISQEAYQIRESYDEKIIDDPCLERDYLFHWERVPYGVLKNIGSISETFDAEPYISNGYLSPDVLFDIHQFFYSPPSRLAATPIAECRYQEIVWDLSGFVESINDCTQPAILDSQQTASIHIAPELSYRLSSGWLRWSPVDLF